jgi:hypothetical protein
MHLKARLSIMAVGFCAAVGLSGCKPKETTFTGQVLNREASRKQFPISNRPEGL